ncbi:bestrophin-1-like [Tigriopus californicus]|uniref:bestrophin-1-like n=1 Tax=Tigriopus californicus TaxID=6832 RepID=UPI0027D9E83A|nr:bestrophin-1-like [Tigriopus californicus]XP_059097883.1 bestrophin-1-like [Tigriopus californicus]
MMGFMIPAHRYDKMSLWKRSIQRLFAVRFLFNLIYKELLVYIIVYFVINIIYRYAINPDQQQTFGRIVHYFEEQLDYYGRDLTFLLGFYVSLAAKRWWDQYQSLPWPDQLAVVLTAGFENGTGQALLIRQTIMRYALLSYVLCLRRFSDNLSGKLGQNKTLRELGLIKKDEMERIERNGFEKTEYRNPFASNWCLPLAWATDLIRLARQQNLIHTDREILREVMAFQHGLQQVENFANVSIPIVYEVVVNCAIYLYFILSLVADQIPFTNQDSFDLYVPIFKIFKLILLMGWLKVAQCIEKPFGDDESDIDMFALVQRHIWTTSIILDQYNKLPALQSNMSSLSTSLASSMDPEEAKKDKGFDGVSLSWKSAPILVKGMPTLTN